MDSQGERAMKPYTKILVPSDFSVHADEALDAAIDLASRYGASITIVHSFEPVIYGFPEATGVYAGFNFADAIEDIDKELEQRKQRALAKGAKNVHTTQLTGFAPSAITEYARDDGYDLIVMGTHGRRGFSRLMTGSVAERVLRMAHCPVLSVRHFEQDAKTAAA
jgi:nucleotide-binding universal stress UspA family protein